MTRHFETSAPSAFVTTLSRAFRDLLRQIGDVLVALEHRREVKHLADAGMIKVTTVPLFPEVGQLDEKS